MSSQRENSSNLQSFFSDIEAFVLVTRRAVVTRRIVHRTHSSNPPSYFEIDQQSLDQIDDLHERAGLFAWRETYRNVATWSPRRRAEVVTRALASMKVTEGDVSLCVEAALFDAEFGQWHIVRCADLLI
jgi:hypothetical protein